MRRVSRLLLLLCFAAVGCLEMDDASFQTGVIDASSCLKGEFDAGGEEIWIYGIEDIEAISGYTECVDLIIGTSGLTDLDGLECLAKVDSLSIVYNEELTSLEGLSGLTSLHWLGVSDNASLPDCEVCDLLDQLTSDPTMDVGNNLDDECTPVPDFCIYAENSHQELP